MRSLTETQSNNISRITLVDRLDKQSEVNTKLKGISFDEVVGAYLEISSRSWSKSTQLSESARLRKLIPALNLHGFNPDKLYSYMTEADLGEYTIKTSFIRLSKLYDFCKYADVLEVSVSINPIKDYMTVRAPNKFKVSNVYKPKKVKSTFKEVVSKIERMADLKIKTTLDFLIKTGLRIHELYKIETTEDGRYIVKGKGGKYRFILIPPPKEIPKLSEIRKALDKMRLTPHSLRKLLATELASSNVPASSIQQMFGWSSINTAQSYIQAASFDELNKQVMRVINNGNEGI